MKRLLLPLLAAIAFPNFLNANPFLNETLVFREVYSSNNNHIIKVTKHYDDFYKTTECKITTTNSGSWDKDPLKPIYRKGEWQLQVKSSTLSNVWGEKPLSGYKFDNGEIAPIEKNTISYIPFSIWRNYKEITFNTGTTYYLNTIRDAIYTSRKTIYCQY